MTFVEWLLVITAILLVLALLAVLALWEGVKKIEERLAKCGNATKELVDIENAAREADREKSREKCERVNERIDAWNAKYAKDCADGRTVPKLNCRY